MANEVESKSTKAWYKSKTIGFNIALGLIGVLEASTGTIEPLLGDHYGFVMMVVAMAGVTLRAVSTATLEKR